MTDLTIQLLCELIDEVYKPTPIRKLPTGQRRAYHRAAVAKSRAKARAALANGIVTPTRQHIRDALADAAMHILRSEAAGAGIVRDVLQSVFTTGGEPAIAKIKSQKIVPRFFKSG